MSHVMISYQWDHQVFVKRLHQALVAERIPVWLDIEGGMHGNINAAMAFGVEKAAVLCPVLTARYQQSRNCQKELNYADTCKVPIAPLCPEAGYVPSGWVGAITAGLTIVDFTDESRFNESVAHIVREIRLLWGNMIGLGQARPVSEWTTEDCLHMLVGLSLEQFSEQFQQKGIIGSVLGSITDQDLIDMGMTERFHRKKLLLEIQYLLNSKKPKEPEEYKKKAAERVERAEKAENVQQQQQQQEEEGAEEGSGAVTSSSSGLGTQLVKSGASYTSTHVNFRNDSPNSCNVLWIDFEGNEVHYYTLAPGESYRQQTYLEHPWVARDAETNDFLLVNGVRLMFPDIEETVGVITGEKRGDILKGSNNNNNSSSSAEDTEQSSFVLISYEDSSFDLASQICDALTEKSIPARMYFEGSEDASKLIESAKVICPIMTQSYQDSKKTQRELNYADTRSVPIAPIMAQTSWRQTGWLGAITAGLLYVDFTDSNKFNTSIGHLIHEIVNLWGDVLGKGHATPVHEWDEEELAAYLNGKDLSQYVDKFLSSGINGRTFISLTESEFAELDIDSSDISHLLSLISELTLEAEVMTTKKAEEAAAAKPKAVQKKESQPNRVVKSSGGGSSTHVNFENQSSFECEVFWIDYEGNEVKYNLLHPGGRYRQQTYVEHPWVVRAVGSGDYLLINGARLFFPDAEETLGVITGESREDVNKISDQAQNILNQINALSSKEKFSLFSKLKNILHIQ